MNTKCEFSNGATSGVDRATELVKAFFQASRGRHENDDQTVRAIANRANVTPATVRKYLQPSRRPKDVSLGVWTRLVDAYRRFLRQQITALELEVSRLESLGASDRAILALLDDAKDLVRNIEAAAGEGEGALPIRRDEEQQ